MKFLRLIAVALLCLGAGSLGRAQNYSPFTAYVDPSGTPNGWTMWNAGAPTGAIQNQPPGAYLYCGGGGGGTVSPCTGAAQPDYGPQTSVTSAATVAIPAGAQNLLVTGSAGIISAFSGSAVGQSFAIQFNIPTAVQAGGTLTLPNGWAFYYAAVGDILYCTDPATAGSLVCGTYASVVPRSVDNQYYNDTPSAFTSWIGGRNSVEAGTGQTWVLTPGDSTSMGSLAGTGSLLLDDAYPNSFPNIFLETAATSYLPMVNGSIFDDQCAKAVAGETYPTYDPRLALAPSTGSWIVGPVGGYAGFMFQWPTGSTAGTFTFSPGASVTADTLIVPYITNGFGSFTASFNAIPQGTIDEGGTSGYHFSTPFTLGAAVANPVTQYTSGTGTVYTAGAITYNSRKPQVNLIQSGCYGSTTASWTPATAPWDASNVLRSLLGELPGGVSLVLFDLTINDSNASLAPATWRSNMAQLITTVQATSPDPSIGIMTGPPSNTTQASTILPIYKAEAVDLARQYNVGVFNLAERWGSYSNINRVIPYAPGGIHPATYWDVAYFLSKGLMF